MTEDLFLEFAEQRLLGILARMDSALRKLPRLLADPLGPEHLAALIA